MKKYSVVGYIGRSNVGQLGDKIVKEYTLDIDFNIEKTPGLDYDRMLYNRLLEKIKKELELLSEKYEKV